VFVIFDDSPDVPQFVPWEAAATFEPHRIQPELGLIAVPLYMHACGGSPIRSRM
jgi:hypothetical protein